MNLNEFLAVEVMGWKLETLDQFSFWVDPKQRDWTGKDRLQVENSIWNPRENIEQAKMCAEQMIRYVCGKGKKSEPAYSAVVYFNGKAFSASGGRLEEALSLAVARARGYRDEH